MVMDTLQIRLSHGLIEKIDDAVKSGMYHSRSEFIREAVRKVLMEGMSVAHLHHGANHVHGKGKEKLTHFREDKQNHYIL